MKRYLTPFLLLPWLAGCLSVNRPVTQADVTGTWQYEDTGILGSVQTLRFQEDGGFSYQSTDTIVGLEMKGEWKLEDDRICLFPAEVKVRGKPEPVSQDWSKGFLTQPLARRGRKFFLQLEEDREFERIDKSVNRSR
jgi:hypothetical protein